MLKKIFSFAILTVMFIYNFTAFAVFPETSAKAVAVLDCSTGRIIYSKNGNQQMTIASTTKIMTALVAIENMDMEHVVTITQEHMAEGSSMYLKPGEKVKVKDLLYGLMMTSGNDAALALACSIDGGKERFIQKMNEKAAEIGMRGSSFKNPNGLDEEGHYSTAEDMALLAYNAMKNGEFRKFVGTKNGTFAGRYMTNHNKLLSRIDGATGIKTGYTMKSGRCLVSSVLRDGREIIVVTLSDPNDWRDHTLLHEAAIKEYPVHKLYSKGEILTEIPVAGTNTCIPVFINDDICFGLKESELNELETVIYLPKFIYNEMKMNEKAGELAVFLSDRELCRVPLFFGKN